MKSPVTTSTVLHPLALAVLTVCGLAACQRQPPAEPAVVTAEPAAAPAPAAAAAPAVVADDALPTGVLRAYVWECADGQTLVMRNLLREQAVAIDFHDGTRRLDQAISASGAKYTDAVVTFWTKGSTATLERQGMAPVQCEERRAASLREDARVRGVMYRALGNEPGWVLEVGPASRMSWTTNWGQDRFDFEQAEASTAPDGAIIYTAQQGDVSIRASIKAERCVDDGEVEFDHVVTVESGGQTLRGCGTRLNGG